MASVALVSMGKIIKITDDRSEAQIQKAICDLLALKRIPYTVTNASRYRRTGLRNVSSVKTGWSDITACFPGGRFCAIEVKNAKGRLRPAQKERLALIEKAGGLVIVARSANDVYIEIQKIQ